MTSFGMPRPPWSTRLHITFVPTFAPSDPKAAILRLPKGTGGVYRVTFVLTKPGKEYFCADLNYEVLMRSGDSLLLLPKGVAYMKAEMFNESKTEKEVEALLSANSRGALATVQIRLPAPNIAEAQKAACNRILPFLSWCSYRYDVAIDVAGYEIVEEDTEVIRYVFACQGQEKVLVLDESDAIIAVTPEYRVLFASYREAGNATNPFYQFLCYYRVTEGVRKLRAQRQKAPLTGLQREVIPTNLKVDQFWEESFAPYLGMKFNRALNQFRDLVRNAIAHLDPASDSLVADKFEDVEECEKAIPVIKHIAREMLRNELAADTAVPSSVTPE